MFAFLLISIPMLCPFLIFLDYHKKQHVHKAIIFLIVFFVVVGGLLPFLALTFRMIFAASIPVIFLCFILISKYYSKNR